jgi:hypothetical protein
MMGTRRLEADLSTVFTAQVKNEWSFNSTPPYMKMLISFKNGAVDRHLLSL